MKNEIAYLNGKYYDILRWEGSIPILDMEGLKLAKKPIKKPVRNVSEYLEKINQIRLKNEQKTGVYNIMPLYLEEMYQIIEMNLTPKQYEMLQQTHIAIMGIIADAVDFGAMVGFLYGKRKKTRQNYTKKGA